MAITIEISDETFEKIREQLGEDSFKDIQSLQDMVGESSFLEQSHTI